MKKLNCKSGNYQCGGRCIRGIWKCKSKLNPLTSEQLEISTDLIRKILGDTEPVNIDKLNDELKDFLKGVREKDNAKALNKLNKGQQKNWSKIDAEELYYKWLDGEFDDTINGEEDIIMDYVLKKLKLNNPEDLRGLDDTYIVYKHIRDFLMKKKTK